tara:strand:- start:398 stop:700 length:303 start_codon:yes stop_codon:yes gene_type:complete
MATFSAGDITVTTTEIVIWEDSQGASSVFILNGSFAPTHELYVHVDGLHASGDYVPLGMIAFGSQLVSYATFTIRPRGIKKITAKRLAGSGAVYVHTLEV